MTDNNNNKTKKTTRNKPMCVLCHVPLYKSEKENEDYQWICSKNKSHKYQLYYEVMSYESDFGTVLGEEEENQIELAGLEGVGEPALLSSSSSSEQEKDNNDNSMKPEEVLNATNNKVKSDIPIPKYFKDSETTKVIEYREE